MDELSEFNFEGLLKQTYVLHQDLGIGGKEIIREGVNETVTRLDYECEEIIIDGLKDTELAIHVKSEEHEDSYLNCTKGNQKYLAIIDGVDGTSKYLAKGLKEGRYATMFAIFDNADPTYNDYFYAGVMEHASNSLYSAIKGEGAFLENRGEIHKRINSSIVGSLDKSLRIWHDEGYDSYASETYPNTTIIKDSFLSKLTSFTNVVELGASAVGYVDVANGYAQFCLECTRGGLKQNLELGVGYAIVKEAGGVIVDINGDSIGPRKYLEFGQGEGEFIPTIAAGNDRMAKELVEYLKSH